MERNSKGDQRLVAGPKDSVHPLLRSLPPDLDKRSAQAPASSTISFHRRDGPFSWQRAINNQRTAESIFSIFGERSLLEINILWGSK
ncbi:hypothetical protein GDO78_002241 [Eleutherodactylus coqui]|uniref:Uncharacterized protein n=1 Tax=Eleutherodactylus coqui TaxID=57060 RepID=A0A8J6EVF2_ELECQ|nr:hypothetical protein GDO78_002241 [Eleutherodactylus coqui]